MSFVIKKTNLERIALKMTSSLDLQGVLTAISQGLVHEVDAAFARIWLVEAGDICKTCHMAHICPNRERCLHLKASSGMYEGLNGEYRRVPLGALKIGRIASERSPIYTNQVLGDDRIQDRKWARDNGFRSFAGYPLVFREEVLGVMSLFSRNEILQPAFADLEVFANQAAIAIKNAKLFEEVKQLKNRLQVENVYLRQEIKLSHNYDQMIGRSKPFLKALSLVEQVAATDATVLILGETGTGKELIARTIHNASPLNHHPMVKVNCAALPASLIESELFGHEKGAFTGALANRTGRFEIADDGTLFLDEIGDFHLELQPKLLRVLQEGTFERVGGNRTLKVKTRIIAATNADLYQLVKDGKFRQDLYYRLNVFPIQLPPLRQRGDDIPELALHFVQKYNAKYKKSIQSISSSLIDSLHRYQWPGNIRELENIIERAVIISCGPELILDEMFQQMVESSPVTQCPKTLQEAERHHIVYALEQCGWVIEGQKGTASMLAIHPATLRSRMKKLGIRRPG